MVAQTKADVRIVADKPAATGRKGVQDAAVVEGKELDNQAAAAAVVDADQAEAVAAQVAAQGWILPTEAPSVSIGEVAQMTSPTTTDTTTTSTTTPPPVAEAGAGLSPWAIGGIALLGVGAIAAVSNSDDDDDGPIGEAPPPAVPPPVDVPTPGPAPVPAPGPAPANVAPTSANSPVTTDADGSTALAATNFPFADTDAGDALTTVRIGTVTPGTPVDVSANPLLAFEATSGHGYELVTGATTWAEANAAALAKGGHLAILNSEAEALFIKEEFELGGGVPQSVGTWVGLSQAVTATLAPDTGWSWVDGTELPVGSTFWNVDPQAPQDFSGGDDTFGTEDGEAQFGAIFETFGGSGNPVPSIMYDYGVAESTVDQYLIEYDSPLTLNGFAVAPNTPVAVADLANLSWNSMFATGGSLTFAVADNDGVYSTPVNTMTFSAPQAAVGTMIDDQHLSVLG